MRRSAILVGLMLVAAAAAAAPAAIQVNSTVREFGAVRQGTVLDLEFVVRNTGGEPLTIEVRPTCGCTVVDYDPTVAPGGEGVIRAKLDTSELTGPITKSVLVVSNDPEQPTVRLLARADVRPILAVLPRPIVRLGTIEGTSAKETVVLAPFEEGHDYSVVDAKSTLPYLTATVRRLAEGELVAGHPAPQYAVDLTLAENSPVGIVNGQVTVSTDLDGARTLIVKVVGRVAGG